MDFAPRPFVSARSAFSSPSAANARVFWRELVPSRAVGFIAVVRLFGFVAVQPTRALGYACFAQAVPSWRKLCVFVGERVSAYAMRFSGVFGQSGVSAQNVFGSGHRLQVDRVNTASVSARVIQHQICGNWTNKELVRLSMRRRGRLAREFYLAVPAETERARPRPAFVRPMGLPEQIDAGRKGHPLHGLFPHAAVVLEVIAEVKG